eukprot:11219824-Lingulodinium_polyedra.AAC.1
MLQAASKLQKALQHAEALVASKEIVWSKLPTEERPAYAVAVAKQWDAWLDNQAVEVIPPNAAQQIIDDLDKD